MMLAEWAGQNIGLWTCGCLRPDGGAEQLAWLGNMAAGIDLILRIVE